MTASDLGSMTHLNCFGVRKTAIESLPHGPNETVEVNHGLDLHTILAFRLLDLKTIENRSNGDPNGVVGEVAARANPAHNK